MSEVLERLAAASSLLVALRGRSSFERVSRAEREAVHALLIRSKLPNTELGDISKAVLGCGFADSDRDTLLDAIGEYAATGSPMTASSASAALGTRNGLQNFEAASIGWQIKC